MGNSNLLYKFLEAGPKSSVVVLDPELDTGNEQTLYLYNQQRDRIIEYRRDIAEGKLRDLNSEEASVASTLQQAYQAARKAFNPRGVVTLETPPPAKPAKPVEETSDDDDFDSEFGDEDFIDDDGEE